MPKTTEQSVYMAALTYDCDEPECQAIHRDAATEQHYRDAIMWLLGYSIAYPKRLITSAQVNRIIGHPSQLATEAGSPGKPGGPASCST